MDSDDMAKLKTLLGYWIEHNREHGEEFLEWAEKEGISSDISEDLRLAAEQMDKASQLLVKAQEKLEGKGT